MKQAIFHPEARHELIESVAFYEARFAGLGYRFLASVETTTGRIEEQPDAGSPLTASYRKWIVAGFPFNVIYLLPCLGRLRLSGSGNPPSAPPRLLA